MTDEYCGHLWCSSHDIEWDSPYHSYEYPDCENWLIGLLPSECEEDHPCQHINIYGEQCVKLVAYDEPEGWQHKAPHKFESSGVK